MQSFNVVINNIFIIVLLWIRFISFIIKKLGNANNDKNLIGI